MVWKIKGDLQHMLWTCLLPDNETDMVDVGVDTATEAQSEKELCDANKWDCR